MPEILTPTGTPSVTVSSSALPTGAATSALQTTGNTSLSSIDGKITAVNTGAVVVSSSALPSGAATASLQSTGNTSLASIDGKITAVNTGAVVVSSSVLPTNAATSALQTTGNTSLSSMDGKITACNTGAVVVSSSALPTGAATAAKQPAYGTAGSASADVLTVQGIASMTALKVDGSAVIQPVSGTVTANIAGSISNTGFTVTNGTGASAVNIQDGGNSITVDGTVTVQQSTATSLKAQAEAYQGGTAVSTSNPLQVSLANTGANTTAVKVDGSAATQPVSGTLTATPPQPSWYVHHVPAANTQATITQAAAGVGVKNRCLGLTVTLAATGTAPTPINLTVSLIDGASGGGTYLWRSVIALPGIAGAVSCITLSGVNLAGTANTAMTLEFSAAGGANTVQSVSMRGSTV